MVACHDGSSSVTVCLMITRRRLLKNSSLALFPTFAPKLSMGKSANGKLSHASIGVDGMGWSDLNSLGSHDRIEITAICDVDTARMEKAAAKYPKARKYQDWRELLEKEGDKIDSVSVTVPDHMHASITYAALKRGKNVYCQKPLTHEVSEARALRLLAEKNGVVTQMGNQIQSAIEYRMGVRMLQDGVIGKIKEIYSWSGAQFPYRGRPAGADPIPKSLNWDMWLGVAKERPFKKGIYHDFNWRGWQAFGGGGLGDFGCHVMDVPFTALELTAPTSVRAAVPNEWADDERSRAENWPDWQVVEYVFPGTKWTAGGSIKLTWSDGSRQPPRELFEFENETRRIPGGGSLFIGEEGKLMVPHISGPQMVPYAKNRGIKRPDVKGFSHYHAYIDACLGKGKTGSNFSYAGPLAETTCLGLIATRVPGTMLEWDAAKLAFANSPVANSLVTPSYREGWEMEGL